MNLRELTGILILLSYTASCGSELSRDRFHVVGSQLMRGTNEFTFRGLESPELALPDLTIEQKAKRLNQICAAGGNGILIDLEVAGDSLDQEWIARMDALTAETRARQMGVILRLFPAGFPEDPERRSAVVQAVGSHFRDRSDLIYWIDGPDSGDLIRLFKRQAGELTVAGSGESDLFIGPGGEASDREKLSLVYGKLPGQPERSPGFVLAGSEASLDLLEETFAAEKIQPVLTSGHELLSEEEKQNGFTPLFDGVSLSGWTPTGVKEGWTVQDGEIRWVRRGGRYLRTVERFGDFVLRLEWKIEEGGNSGLFIRAPLGGRWSRIGMEIQLQGDHGRPAHENGTGSIYDVVAPGTNASRPAGEWNEMEVLCDGPVLRVTLNGLQIQDVNLDAHPVLRLRLKKGFLALQDHGDPVSFRNIRIKRL